MFHVVLYCLFFSVRAPGKYHTTIYPYIHQTCNNRTSADQVRSVVIPDVDPTDVPPDLNFSMAAGDFLEVYTEEGKLQCSTVITHQPSERAKNRTVFDENTCRCTYCTASGYCSTLTPVKNARIKRTLSSRDRVFNKR